MRTLVTILFAFFLIPQALAQDEGDIDNPEVPAEPAIEMTAGELSCYEQGGAMLMDAQVTASTLSNHGMCPVDTNNGRGSCSALRTGILEILNVEENGCSHAINSGRFLGEIFVSGTFVCRGSRNQMVNLIADFCEWAYLH